MGILSYLVSKSTQGHLKTAKFNQELSVNVQTLYGKQCK